MENILTKKKNSLKCESVIKTLSIIALVCTVLSCITYFLDIQLDRFGIRIELDFRSPIEWGLPGVLFFVLALAPVVLLVLYIFKFHNKRKATVIIPIIFGILAFERIFFVLYNHGTFSPSFQNEIFHFLYSNDFYHGVNLSWLFSSNIFYSGGDMYWLFFPVLYRTYDIIGLIIVLCSILMVISALKGFFNNKLLIIIPISLCLLRETLCLLMFFLNIQGIIGKYGYLHLFTSPLAIVGEIALYVALLLFATKNRIPAIISGSVKKNSFKTTNPEYSLSVLKDKFDLGMITEEEYREQRAKIISNL